MTFEEYKIFRKRLKKGQRFLEGKWASEDVETKRLITLWFRMSQVVYEYQMQNGIFPESATWMGIEAYNKLAENDTSNDRKTS